VGTSTGPVGTEDCSGATGLDCLGETGTDGWAGDSPGRVAVSVTLKVRCDVVAMRVVSVVSGVAGKTGDEPGTTGGDTGATGDEPRTEA